MMIEVIRKVVRFLFPASVCVRFSCFYWRLIQTRKMRRYHESNGTMCAEIEELLTRISKNGFHHFPYPWAYSAEHSKIEVMFDDALEMHYTLLDRKRLYFPKAWDAERIRRTMRSVQCVEQHPDSPHRYLSGDFDVNADDCVADCGAAEGNFSLSVVERVKRVYIFEADEEWMDALNATFAPWKDKVEIIQKYVSDEDSETSISLDSFFAGKEHKPTFLKLDVEGYEARVLSGSEDLLKSSVKKVVVCAYHYAKDEAKLTEFMKNRQFDVTPSKEYMLFNLYDFALPYIRRGVLRCVKNP